MKQIKSVLMSSAILLSSLFISESMADSAKIKSGEYEELVLAVDSADQSVTGFLSTSVGDGMIATVKTCEFFFAAPKL